MDRKATTNSVAGSLELVKNLTRTIEPPMQLSELEKHYFDQFLTSREQATWSSFDLHLLCSLARLWVQYDTAFTQGDVLMERYLKQIQELSKTLGLAASTRGMGTSRQQARNQSEIELREAISFTGDNDARELLG